MKHISADIFPNGNLTPGSLESEVKFEMIPLEKVMPNSRQPRKFFDRQKLEELAQSILENGVLQPILVKRCGSLFQIVSGERRYQACKLAGITHIPAVARELGDRQTGIAALIENIQREDLNPVEEARALKEILVTYDLTHDELAGKIGKSRSSLTNRLRILQLPQDVQEMIAKGRISSGHAKMLAGLKNHTQITKWLKRILNENLSVYETEKQMGDHRISRKSNKSDAKTMTQDLHVRRVEENLQEFLGAKVRIRQGKSKGRIEIEFYDKTDLERVLERMIPFQD